MEKKLVCPMCGYVGQKQRFSKGSYVLEIFLWCLLFVPGAIYTTWRAFNEYHACPKCGNGDMAPVGSSLGKKILAEKDRMSEPIPALDLFDFISKILRR